MIYGFEGYEPRGLQAPARSRSFGQATSSVGSGVQPVHIVLVGLGLLAAGYVMTRDERKGARR